MPETIDDTATFEIQVNQQLPLYRGTTTGLQTYLGAGAPHYYGVCQASRHSGKEHDTTSHYAPRDAIPVEQVVTNGQTAPVIQYQKNNKTKSYSFF